MLQPGPDAAKTTIFKTPLKNEAKWVGERRNRTLQVCPIIYFILFSPHLVITGVFASS